MSTKGSSDEYYRRICRSILKKSAGYQHIYIERLFSEIVGFSIRQGSSLRGKSQPAAGSDLLSPVYLLQSMHRNTIHGLIRRLTPRFLKNDGLKIGLSGLLAFSLAIDGSGTEIFLDCAEPQVGMKTHQAPQETSGTSFNMVLMAISIVSPQAMRQVT